LHQFPSLGVFEFDSWVSISGSFSPDALASDQHPCDFIQDMKIVPENGSRFFGSIYPRASSRG